MIGRPAILLLVAVLAPGSSSLLANSLNSGLRGPEPPTAEGPHRR